MCIVLLMFSYVFQRLKLLQPVISVKLWRRRAATFGLLLASYFIMKFDEDNIWSLRILRMDESHLSLTENLKSKSCVHLADEKPDDVTPTSSHETKVTVWRDIENSFTSGVHFCGGHFLRYENLLYQKRLVYKNVAELCKSGPSAAKYR